TCPYCNRIFVIRRKSEQAILDVLKSGTKTNKELQVLTTLSAPSLSEAIVQLEKEGLIAYENSQSDRRNKIYRLTSIGMK
ncbi:MAG: winged helix DNA-binding protein, partial [Bacilli bacterium]